MKARRQVEEKVKGLRVPVDGEGAVVRGGAPVEHPSVHVVRVVLIGGPPEANVVGRDACIDGLEPDEQHVARGLVGVVLYARLLPLRTRARRGGVRAPAPVPVCLRVRPQRGRRGKRSGRRSRPARLVPRRARARSPHDRRGAGAEAHVAQERVDVLLTELAVMRDVDATGRYGEHRLLRMHPYAIEVLILHDDQRVPAANTYTCSLHDL